MKTTSALAPLLLAACAPSRRRRRPRRTSTITSTSSVRPSRRSPRCRSATARRCSPRWTAPGVRQAVVAVGRLQLRRRAQEACRPRPPDARRERLDLGPGRRRARPPDRFLQRQPAARRGAGRARAMPEAAGDARDQAAHRQCRRQLPRPGARRASRAGVRAGAAPRVPMLVHMRPRGGADYGARTRACSSIALCRGARRPDHHRPPRRVEPGYPAQNDEIMAAFADAAERRDPRMANIYFDPRPTSPRKRRRPRARLIAKRMRQIGVARFRLRVGPLGTRRQHRRGWQTLPHARAADRPREMARIARQALALHSLAQLLLACSNTSLLSPGVATIRSSSPRISSRIGRRRTAASGRAAGPAAPRPAG